MIIDFVTGITETVTTQEEIVVAAVESNPRRQSQLFINLHSLFDAFGSCAERPEKMS